MVGSQERPSNNRNTNLANLGEVATPAPVRHLWTSFKAICGCLTESAWKDAMPRRKQPELRFPLILTQAQRKAGADFIPDLADRPAVQPPGPRTPVPRGRPGSCCRK